MPDWSDEDEFYGRVLHDAEDDGDGMPWERHGASSKKVYIDIAKAVREAKYVDPIADVEREVWSTWKSSDAGDVFRAVAKRMYDLGARVKP